MIRKKRSEFIEKVLHFGYNIVLPRYLWDDLPYTLNDKPFKQLLFKTNQLAVYLKSKNILPYLAEANPLMMDLCGYNDYKQFAVDSNHAFFCGDAEQMEQWNAREYQASMLWTWKKIIPPRPLILELQYHLK